MKSTRRRRVAVTNQLDWMRPSIRERWSSLNSLIMIESESYDVSSKKTTVQKRYFISSFLTRFTVILTLILSSLLLFGKRNVPPNLTHYCSQR